MMQMTRYWRGIEWIQYIEELDAERAQAEVYNARGYAFVTVDARGSGASFGGRVSPWSEAEREDCGEVVDWLVARTRRRPTRSTTRPPRGPSTGG